MIRMEQIGATPEAKATLDEPIDHLLACHRRIEERLETLERAADHLTDRREEALQAIRNCFRFLETNGAWHTADEEETVFPRIRFGIDREEVAFLERLEDEHREVERTYAGVKDRFAQLSESGLEQATVEGFREAVARLCAQYRAHIEAEDNRLIDVARAALGEQELAAISREMRERRGLA